MKKPSAKKKEVFFIKRVMVTETTIEVEAADEAEALRLILRGQGEELFTRTHVHLAADDE